MMNSLSKLITFCLVTLITTPILAQEYGYFTDSRDGTTYKTVQIGDQTWLAENMKYITDGIDYKDSKRPNEYGYLYNWKNASKVCPSGWHLPTKVEFDRLLATIGKGIRASDSLRHPKWDKAKNSTGFGALPVGYCTDDGCTPFADAAYFWANTKSSSSKAYGLYVDSSKATVSSGQKSSYLSVRCLMDSAEIKLELAANREQTINHYKKKKKALLIGGIVTGGVAMLSFTAGLFFYCTTDYFYPDFYHDSRLYDKHSSYIEFVTGSVFMGISAAAIITMTVFAVAHRHTRKKLDELEKRQLTLLPAIGKEAGSLVLAVSF